MPDALAVVLLAVLLAVAARCLTTALHTGRRAPAAVEPRRDPRPLVACHRLSCAHNHRPHDETPEGLRCTGCGHINDTAS
ncbi:hypothetical protein ACWD7M_18625 [Streptomyces griseus]